MPLTKADCLPINLVNVVVTPTALEAIERAGQSLDHFLELHREGDWGNLVDEDAAFYDRALISASTVMSEFVTQEFDRLCVYTAIGNYTSVYLPGER